MIDEIRKAILRKINTFRDKDTKIYSESIEQGFQEPCFYIKEVNSSQNRELGNRYKREHLYDIHYFPNPNSSTKNTDMRAMAEVLYEQLEYIEVAGRPLRGYDMNYRIVDGVLHFFVKYSMFVKKEAEPIPFMENLEIKGGLKDG
ncbi:phage tail terminator family protein [Tepidimicrobium xylanilyticum]